ncbi:hypothetical protein [Synergistes jonesii]|nr:hypothetical protein [Synergistes jonesii]
MIKEYYIKSMDDVHNFVKTLTTETLQTAIDAELENELAIPSTTIRISI